MAPVFPGSFGDASEHAAEPIATKPPSATPQREVTDNAFIRETDERGDD
jgi:hypothetical protein